MNKLYTTKLDEIWKDIPEYIGYYQGSSYGDVQSLDRIVFHKRWNKYVNKKGRMLKPYVDKDGYVIYILTKNGISKAFKSHRLVGMLFVENPNNYLIVHHKNTIRNDNYYKNLEWTNSQKHGFYTSKINKNIK